MEQTQDYHDSRQSNVGVSTRYTDVHNLLGLGLSNHYNVRCVCVCVCVCVYVRGGGMRSGGMCDGDIYVVVVYESW